jgi:MoaA/NifB/PqqE/SkfB family radical SAM enzyme
LNDNKHVSVTKDAWEILKYCDGNNSFNEIIEILNLDYEILKEDFLNFLNKAEKLGILEYIDIPNKKNISIFGDGNSIVPLALSLELTNKCNLKCNYCYGGFKTNGKIFWKIEDLKSIFDDFSKIGCMVLELTGGEALLHPEFNEILLLSLSKFKVVNILTNGVLLNNHMIEIITKHKNRISVQISIDGYSEEINYKVRGVKNTFKKSLEAIRQLRNNGIFYKIAYMMTVDNIHEIPQICELFRKEKIKNLLISKAIGFGRACDQKDCIVPKENEDFKKIINAVINEYPDVINEIYYQDIFNRTISESNCGAGWKMFSMNAEGDIVSCSILGKNGYIGNVFKQSIHS